MDEADAANHNVVLRQREIIKCVWIKQLHVFTTQSKTNERNLSVDGKRSAVRSVDVDAHLFIFCEGQFGL